MPRFSLKITVRYPTEVPASGLRKVASSRKAFTGAIGKALGARIRIVTANDSQENVTENKNRKVLLLYLVIQTIALLVFYCPYLTGHQCFYYTDTTFFLEPQVKFLSQLFTRDDFHFGILSIIVACLKSA